MLVRAVRPCERCRSRTWLCEQLARDLRLAVSQVEQRARRSGQALPDVEVVLDCRSWWPTRRRH